MSRHSLALNGTSLPLELIVGGRHYCWGTYLDEAINEPNRATVAVHRASCQCVQPLWFVQYVAIEEENCED
jgi:hypothetical protein